MKDLLDKDDAHDIDRAHRREQNEEYVGDKANLFLLEKITEALDEFLPERCLDLGDNPLALLENDAFGKVDLFRRDNREDDRARNKECERVDDEPVARAELFDHQPAEAEAEDRGNHARRGHKRICRDQVFFVDDVRNDRHLRGHVETAEAEGQEHDNVNGQDRLPIDKSKGNRQHQQAARDVADEERCLAVPSVDEDPGERLDHENRQNGKGHELGEIARRAPGALGDEPNERHLVDTVAELRDHLCEPQSKKVPIVRIGQ